MELEICFSLAILGDTAISGDESDCARALPLLLSSCNLSIPGNGNNLGSIYFALSTSDADGMGETPLRGTEDKDSIDAVAEGD